jgi:steroid delta-isomerase-like uncharacterized protein
VKNELILKDFIQKIWNEKDFNSIAVFVHPEYTIHIDTGDPWEGKTLNHLEFQSRLNYSFNSFPDIHFEIKNTISDGDYAVLNWIMTGTNLGNIGNLPPTNKSIKTSGTTIYHLKNGKVCGHSQVFDRMTVMKQLGFI